MPALNFSDFSGLSADEAHRRLLEEGYNEIPSAERKNLLAIVGEVIREPMFLLLVGAGLIYFILGDVEEGAILLSFVLVIIGITAYQEQKTEKALEALRNLSSPRALVIRNGSLQRIAGREVVRKDVMVVSEGDRVAADALLLSENNLLVDESLLTGESVPVRKAVAAKTPADRRPGGDDQPWLYAGTLVVQGQGISEVMDTGMGTEMGKIGKALQSVQEEETRLHMETSRIVRNIALTGLLLCTTVIVVYGITRADWLHGFLAGITLAMATLPEEFPVVLTIFLALGAWRLSRQNVLTRRIPAIETLGAATVLCVDKTGTLTENRMSVARLGVAGESFPCSPRGRDQVPEPFHELLEFAILSAKKDPFDPLEQALLRKGGDDLRGTEHLHGDWDLLQEYPLSRELLAMSNVWRSREGREYVIAAKGAPEAIADLCHLGAERQGEISAEVEKMASDGLRVLGVAKAYFTEKDLPDGQHDFPFTFLGLVGFADPVRKDVPGAVAECGTAGIRVVMITGDYPATARNIGRQIHLPLEDGLVTGPELDRADDLAIAGKIRGASIFARVVPEQKLRIVEAFKASGEVVAMTGDGVNDAPALKAAHIGIAMGGRGSDVAREASSLVLLDDNFASIVAAVRMGRRIYANLKKAMAYIISVHVPIAGISLAPVLLGWPLILLPVHIVFLELIIDPACSVVFEAEREEPDIMKRPPRRPEDRLLDRRTLILVNRSWSENIVQTLRVPNRAFWAVIGGTLFFLALAVAVPAARGVFRFAVFHPLDLLFCIIAGILSVLWFEVYKIARPSAGP